MANSTRKPTAQELRDAEQEATRIRREKEQEKLFRQGWPRNPAELTGEEPSEAVKNYLKNKGKKEPLGGKAV